MPRFKFTLLFLLSLLAKPAFAQLDTVQQRINHYISSAEFDSARVYIQTKLNDVKQAENVNSLNYQLLTVLFIQSDYNEALTQAFVSLDKIEDKQDRVNFNFIIGCVYSAIKDYGKSIEYFDLVVRDTKDSSMMVKAHLLSSELYLELKDSTKSGESLSKAYDITCSAVLDNKVERHVAMQYNFFNGNYELCKQQNFTIIEDSTSFLSSKSYAFMMVGDCLVGQDSLAEAVRYYDELLALSLQTKDPEQVQEAAKKLIDTYEALGDQERANTYHKIYNEAASDSMSFSIEKYRELYEFENSRALSSAKSSRNYLLWLVLLVPIFLFWTYHYFNDKGASPELADKPDKAPGKKIVISNIEIEKIKAAIDQLIAEQLFLTPKITRKSFCIAHEIKSERYLSHYVNAEYKKSFSVFINDLRIEYAYKRIQSDSTFRNYRIEEIAKESGFGSKKSFERVFAAKYEETPYKLISKLID